MSATHVNDDAKYGGAEPCSARYVSGATVVGGVSREDPPVLWTPRVAVPQHGDTVGDLTIKLFN